MNIAETIFAGKHAKLSLEDELWDMGVQFEETSFDSYDCSIELLDVPDDYRLSLEAQELIFKAGFSIVFMNHKNKWETHYSFGQGPFKEIKG